VFEGAQRDTVVWSAKTMCKQLLAATLKDGIDRYLADTTIEHKACERHVDGSGKEMTHRA